MAMDTAERKQRMQRHKTNKSKMRITKRGCPVWELRLYVADATPRSVLASGNLQSLCEQYLQGNFHLTIIDIVKQPSLARTDDILATPTLVRVLPQPQMTLVGSLSDTDRVLKVLGMNVEPEKLRSSLCRTGSA
jgi:circadian clock protein KaiB